MSLNDRIALALGGVVFVALAAAGFAIRGSPTWLNLAALGLGGALWFAAFDSGGSQ